MLIMPIINVKLLEVRSDEQLKDLVTEVTHAV
ncbi:4-oxalocrotonate tautomerase, partial [Ralstonia insidiosa]|nr:4-oxalocrotonate tautomerase [Ralstonia insidiosa]